MWYFAYGIDLNWQAVGEWCETNGRMLPWREKPEPAVLENYRLHFPAYDPYWRGGAADVIPEPGKSVKGGLFWARPAVMKILDAMFGRSQDQWERENGLRRRHRVTVFPYSKRDPIPAVIYRLHKPAWQHVPPTEDYVQRLTAGAAAMGFSAMWVMYLRSFPMIRHAEPANVSIAGEAWALKNLTDEFASFPVQARSNAMALSA